MTNDRLLIGGQYRPDKSDDANVIEAFEQIKAETQWDTKTIVSRAILEYAQKRHYVTDLVMTPILLESSLSTLLHRVIHATEKLVDNLEVKRE